MVKDNLDLLDDADDLLNDDEDDDMLQLQQDADSESAILNMLDDEEVPTKYITPMNKYPPA